MKVEHIKERGVFDVVFGCGFIFVLLIKVFDGGLRNAAGCQRLLVQKLFVWRCRGWGVVFLSVQANATIVR